MRTVRSSSHLLGGVCLSACWDTPPPGPGPGHPPRHTPWTWASPWADTPWAWAWTPPEQTPPWAWSPPSLTEFLTHACENITFPQLRLRTVKITKIRLNIVWLKCRYLSPDNSDEDPQVVTLGRASAKNSETVKKENKLY